MSQNEKSESPAIVQAKKAKEISQAIFAKPEPPKFLSSDPEESPKENCKKCWGRGYLGIDIKTNEYVLCSCVEK